MQRSPSFAWISAAGTAWATIALLLTLEPTVTPGSLPNGQQLIAAFHNASVEPTRSSATVSARIASSNAATIEFARDIQPIFERSCTGCHGGSRPKAAFTLHSRDALLKGGQSGDPAIVPGNADASPLFRQVSGIVEDLEMPPLSRREKYPALSADNSSGCACGSMRARRGHPCAPSIRIRLLYGRSCRLLIALNHDGYLSRGPARGSFVSTR